eukprot:COSAG02_NODE_31864_length_526_cov_0.725995_1_plen_90_part_01
MLSPDTGNETVTGNTTITGSLSAGSLVVQRQKPLAEAVRPNGWHFDPPFPVDPIQDGHLEYLVQWEGCGLLHDVVAGSLLISRQWPIIS